MSEAQIPVRQGWIDYGDYGVKHGLYVLRSDIEALVLEGIQRALDTAAESLERLKPTYDQYELTDFLASMLRDATRPGGSVQAEDPLGEAPQIGTMTSWTVRCPKCGNGIDALANRTRDIPDPLREATRDDAVTRCLEAQRKVYAALLAAVRELVVGIGIAQSNGLMALCKDISGPLAKVRSLLGDE